MALGKYKLTATVTVPAGTAATVVAGEPGTGGASGYGGAPLAAGQVQAPWPTTFIKDTVIELDSASALYTALSANLVAWTGAAEAGGGGGIDGVSN